MAPQHPIHGGTPPNDGLVLSWEQSQDNPYNWSWQKKTYLIIVVMIAVMNVSIGSSLPNNAMPYILIEFDVDYEQAKVLPQSIFLIGYVFGPILWAPLSEYHGRRIVIVGTFFIFTLFTMACALSPTWPSFLIFRLVVGTVGSGPPAIVPGVLADVAANGRTRGLLIAIYMAATSFGPVLGPIISASMSLDRGWRWTFWVGLFCATASMMALFLVPETFRPVLVTRFLKANSSMQRGPSSQSDGCEEQPLHNVPVMSLTRPIRMLFCEPIVSASSAYLALCFSIYYMTFPAFTIIFQNLYEIEPVPASFVYLPIGAGCVLALPILLGYDLIRERALQRDKIWAEKEELKRLPLACVGGLLFTSSLFWLAWTARRDMSALVPMLAGIPFGIGFMCIFVALLNYLTDAYKLYAASANAASACSRSLLATVLPLATDPMFRKCGITGACGILGGISLAMCLIPLTFIWQGSRLRTASKLCAYLEKATSMSN